MAELVLGPLLRYAGTEEAHDLGRDRRARARSRSLEGARPQDVLRRGPPLRARALRGPRARTRSRPTRCALDGETVWPLPDSPFPPSVVRTHDAGPADADHVRLLPRLPRRTSRRTRCARTSTPTAARSTRCAALAQRMAEQDPTEWPRRAAAARRPGLRRRGLARRARVHPLAPRPRGAAGRDGRRLRGVHAPVPGVVGRALHALAALDRALVDDLRRPRRPRRLEHVDRPGSPTIRAPGLVGRPHRRRLHVVLDLPAPRATSRRASWPRTTSTRACARPTTPTRRS